MWRKRTGTEAADCKNDYEMQEAENTKITKKEDMRL